ncbi:hypothetical protein EXIGLDRAFT_180939 [Exidia glandulosa HHB12029]|uniref:MARVEL domain-containing protein n=1 Tax=Exidia glandulosa HHB12029 TaxID=1314781 RepID=A0A165F3R8_EXIGL|nr:hypothetical protein EXIGLDRAFT_782036 [Exidia glandulosa HHB12029]KZV88322.1 hypothetical protein EXIGLDRAFT_180939 [Exidia glandulosa HHB12029]
MHAFFYIRVVAHPVLFLLNVLLLGFAGAAVANCHHVGAAVPVGLVLILLASCATIVLVPLALCGLWVDNAFFSRVWFEVSWVCILALVHFSATVLLTTGSWSALCHIAAPATSSPTDIVAGILADEPCERYLGMISLSWAASLIILIVALIFLAISVGHACITSSLWNADIAEVEWFRSSSASRLSKISTTRSSPRMHISRPMPVEGHDSVREKWSNVDLESNGTGTGTGSSDSVQLGSHHEQPVQTRFSRFSLYRIVQNMKAPPPSRLDTSRPPAWAQRARRPGIDLAFPVRPGPPVPTRPPRLATPPPPPRVDATLPPTPVTTRPSNPEPATPSPTTPGSEPPTPPPKTLTRQIAELELAFVFDEGSDEVLPKSQTPRSVRSYASTDFGHSSVFGSSPPRPNPLRDGDAGREWLELPPPARALQRQSSYDSEAYCASSVYSQPSMPPTRTLVPRKQ